MEEEMILNPYELFVQETYEEAVKKSNDETKGFAKTKRFVFNTNGTYAVRILPIAPVQVEGKWVLDRKGYEYPIKTHVLNINNPNSKGKNDKQFAVNVCHSSYAGISVDLIDTYVNVAYNLYSNSKEDVIKKIQKSSFDKGLKWNSQRCMYVYDMKKRSEGIQLLTISYSQYRELEERKLNVWKKLLEKNPKHGCPISSLQQAFPVEITRKEENKKVSYSFNVDTLSDNDKLTEEEVNALMEAPRLPEVLYRYTRFHLEATIEFLKQYDNMLGINVMDEQEIKDAIQKINLELPSDDKSHFKFGGKSSDDDTNDQNDIDALWDRLEDIEDKNLGVKSEEYQELRDDICKFIEDNDLSVRATRNKTNKDLLEAIEDALANKGVSDDENDDDNEPENTAEEEEESRSRDEYNEDTNEPARRAARTERRRVR